MCTGLSRLSEWSDKVKGFCVVLIQKGASQKYPKSLMR